MLYITERFTVAAIVCFSLLSNMAFFPSLFISLSHASRSEWAVTIETTMYYLNYMLNCCPSCALRENDSKPADQFERRIRQHWAAFKPPFKTCFFNQVLVFRSQITLFKLLSVVITLSLHMWTLTVKYSCNQSLILLIFKPPSHYMWY